MAADSTSEPPLDVELVELALKWTGIDLDALLETWELRTGRWWDYPACRDFLSMHAVRVHMKRHRARGAKWRAAVVQSCEELGLNAEAVESRLRRHDRAYLRANEKPLDDLGKMPEKRENLG